MSVCESVGLDVSFERAYHVVALVVFRKALGKAPSEVARLARVVTAYDRVILGGGSQERAREAALEASLGRDLN